MRTSLLERSKNLLNHFTEDKSDIYQIILHCTDVCNLNCKYCSRGLPFQKNRKSYFASEFIPWIHFLIEEGIKFKTISITGGEPFLHANIFNFIDEIKNDFPDKVIRITTNFSWANEKSIKEVAPKLKNLSTLTISEYPAVVEKSGGRGRFGALVRQFQEQCPHLQIEIREQGQFIAWELHAAVDPVDAGCVSNEAKCPALSPEGIVTRCAVSIGSKNIREYRPILENNKEYCFDLKKWNKKEFLRFVHKYPFDLCRHCSLWRCEVVQWTNEDRIIKKELMPI
ncbi:MAG: radical SAM protein [Halobacteriota archaeon]